VTQPPPAGPPGYGPYQAYPGQYGPGRRPRWVIPVVLAAAGTVAVAVLGVVLVLVMTSNKDDGADGGAGQAAQGVATTGPATPPSPDGQPLAQAGNRPLLIPTDNGAEGLALIQQFLTAVNAGKGAAAGTMLCPDTWSESRSAVVKVSGQHPNLRIDTSSVHTGGGYARADLLGTVNGQQVRDGDVSTTLGPSGYCILTFGAYLS
jgi:hypothetical protein